MSLEKVLSITGKPGLYRLTTQTRSGFLAESLIDGKKVSVSGRHNVSLLSEIAIYTLTEEVPLRKVFEKIFEKENGGPAIGHKSTKDELEEYFFAVLPDYDEDRVYASDIKKVVQWYNLLQKNGMTDFSDSEESSEENAEESDTKEVKAKEVKKTAKTAAKPKTAANPKGGTPKASSSKKGGAAKSTAARKK